MFGKASRLVPSVRISFKVKNSLAFSDSCELKFSHDLDGLKPLGFDHSEYVLLLYAQKGSSLVGIYITCGPDQKWTLSKHHLLLREKSIRLVSTSWPEESCKAIVKKGEKLELIKYKLNLGSVTIDRCADSFKARDRVLYRTKNFQVSAVGTKLMINKNYTYELTEVPVAAEYSKLGCPRKYLHRI